MEQAPDFGSGPPVVILIVELVFIVLMLAGLWTTFAKAGQPGWAAIIPIYNGIVMLQVAGKPVWWIILFFIPCVGIIFAFITMFALAERFGKGAGFAIGLIFLPFIFYPLLGFGDAKYTPAPAA